MVEHVSNGHLSSHFWTLRHVPLLLDIFWMNSVRRLWNSAHGPRIDLSTTFILRCSDSEDILGYAGSSRPVPHNLPARQRSLIQASCLTCLLRVGHSIRGQAPTTGWTCSWAVAKSLIPRTLWPGMSLSIGHHILYNHIQSYIYITICIKLIYSGFVHQERQGLTQRTY